MITEQEINKQNNNKKISHIFNFITTLSSHRQTDRKKEMSKRSLKEELNDIVNGFSANGDDFYDDDELEEDGLTTTQRINSLSKDFIEDSDAFSHHERATSMKAKASEPELDAKFSGKKVSRKDLDSWFTGEDDNDEEGGMDEDEEGEESEGLEDTNDGAAEKSDEMITKAAAEAERLHKELLRGSTSKKGKKDDKFSMIDKKAIEMDFEKAKETRTQNSLWEVFVESRIKLQQSLNLINGNSPLFTPEKISSVDVTSTDEEKDNSEDSEVSSTKSQLQKSKDLITETFASCMDVMKGLWNQNSEITSSCGTFDDVTIASSDTSDAETDDMTSFDAMSAKFKRGEKAFMTGFCAPVLDRWYQRTQIGGINSTGDVNGSKKFKLVNQDINTQIDQILRDRQRLVQRTRINRLRPSDVSNDVTADKPSAKKGKLNNENVYDAEIFDDTDFYGELLRELIDSGSAGARGGDNGRDSLFGDGNDANSELNRIKNLRKKSKRVNSNASNKGRRVKYDVIPELVSFMAPVDSTKETRAEWDTQQLYSNLFVAK